MRGKTTGISFTRDATHAYAVELAVNKGNTFLKNLTQTEIGSDLRAAVAKTVQNAGLKGRRAVLTLSGHDAIVRCFEMPTIPTREIANAVRFEAQKYIPFDVKDLYFDYETYSNLKKRKLMVVFTAAKKDLIDGWIKALSAAGVEVAAVEPDLMALLRLANQQRKKNTGEMQAFISARADRSLDVVVAKGNKPFMARYGVVASSSVQESSQFGRNFESFAKEIALSFNYFSKNFREEEIRGIVWSADPVYESETWIKGLHARFDIPVEEWDISSFLGKTGAALPATTVLIGAAIRPIQKTGGFLSFLSGRKIPNLLPEATVETVPSAATPDEEFQKQALIRRAIHVSVAAMAALFLAHASLLHAIETARKNQGILVNASAAQLKDNKACLEAQAAYLNNLFNDRNYWSEKLSDVAKNVPVEAQLIRMDATDIENSRGEVSLTLKIEGNVFPSEPGKELLVASRFVGTLLADPHFMKGFDSAVLTRVGKAQSIENLEASSMVFTLECASKKKDAA